MIDLEKIEKHLKLEGQYNIGDALILYVACSGGDIMTSLLKLKQKGLLAWRGARLCPTQRGLDLMREIYLANEGVSEDGTADLAQRMWELWPDIPQPSTGRPARGSLGDVVMRLRLIPKEYGLDGHSDDEILAAEQGYLDSLGGNYMYLTTLPDFIFQAKGDSMKSRLCEFLENKPSANTTATPMLTL